MKYVCYGITLVCCIIAGFELVFTITSANGAPQEAAGAAIAAALVIIPYVFTRCVDALSAQKMEEQNQKIIELLKQQNEKSLA
jgi:hypothetical protein